MATNDSLKNLTVQLLWDTGYISGSFLSPQPQNMDQLVQFIEAFPTEQPIIPSDKEDCTVEILFNREDSSDNCLHNGRHARLHHVTADPFVGAVLPAGTLAGLKPVAIPNLQSFRSATWKQHPTAIQSQ